MHLFVQITVHSIYSQKKVTKVVIEAVPFQKALVPYLPPKGAY